MKRLIPLFFALTFFLSCDSSSTPDGIIPKDKMIAVLTDMQVVDAYVSAMTIDSVKKNKVDFYQSVFNKHEIDSIKFRKSLRFYSHDPAKLQLMYEQVQIALDTLQVKVTKEDVVKKK